MPSLEKQSIKLGYIPLIDCIAILWAKHRGFFEELGLDVTLIKETSWASLRDRLAFGVLDAAHCLSAMLPAAAIGLDQIGIPLQTSLTLSTNRAFLSLNQNLCFEYKLSASNSALDNAEKAIKAIKEKGHLNLAHVFNHSIHHYCLKEWLSLADPKIAKELQYTTCSPAYLIQTLKKREIDGFCAGEPWNTQSQIHGYSQVIVDSKQIIPDVADKVLAITNLWAKDNPATLNALTQAIIKAQSELNSLTKLTEAWELLQDYGIIQFECSESIHVESYYKLIEVIKNLSDTTKPKAFDFEWIIKQMCKWDNLILEEKEINKFAKMCIYERS
ncbi:hypothetical protein P256_00263 [Acinetobacter nectaris CIP 110549]|uniref:SsuA/THI5-like domain-containing protein n=1 Tax=Acinetobacter nectaris CIP 110549 TaxID=1392540 RepID=V2TGN3_9GAMM|nr:ABC transporter substrate-binding protein [Acinetobacter nectaris]ESK41273.1 hypothetical protein P256_00263 [Acinetobacter nectaris CIP 110549]